MNICFPNPHSVLGYLNIRIHYATFSNFQAHYAHKPKGIFECQQNLNGQLYCVVRMPGGLCGYVGCLQGVMWVCGSSTSRREQASVKLLLHIYTHQTNRKALIVFNSFTFLLEKDIFVSYISTRSTFIPHGSVASSSTVWKIEFNDERREKDAC